MQQRLAEKTAAVVALSRNILANTTTGLVTAALLGFWSPALQKVAQPAHQPEVVRKLNIDPVSGKILDRVKIAEEPTAPAARLQPLLVGYALPGLSTAPGAETAPQTIKKPTAKAQSESKAQRPSALETESRNMPTAVPVAEAAAPAQMAESEGWMSKLSPGALSAKLAPVGGYVSGGVAAARQAVADRLEAIGF